ncbi:MAG: hypothetical protein EPO52_10215 [Herbiconiux sp.]|uniref:nuclear transport factor 2 family protein n=1 Tax=Herbiconiux sp. TaxID=1871186 RepID=UPI0011FD59B8|nr:nuclear transport factor 2 family protein [Herbiconiux sp.]TAJ48493.1 MAG: hypothetical protein EPO52_10215 [Herbiconiux sp.]
MTGFEMIGGVARIDDPEIFRTWIDREDFKAAVAAHPSPEIAAVKRLCVDFEADLARMVCNDTVQDDVVAVMDRYVSADEYVQHDPNAPGDGRDNLIEYFRNVPTGDGMVPPPVVSVMVDGELATIMMMMPLPDPAAPGSFYDWYMLTTFRVRNLKLVEHWTTFRKLPPGMPPM